MGEMKEYKGSCHCGQVRYTVNLDLSAPVTACNCSICKRTGTLLTFAPADQFKLNSGEQALTDYQFNRNVIHHVFCSKCGVRSFARGKKPDGSDMVAINARCLDGVDPEKLNINHYDGASH